MVVKFNFLAILACVPILFNLGCKQRQNFDDLLDIKNTNNQEITKIIDYYQNQHGEKLEMASFLLQTFPHQYTLDYKLIKSGAEIISLKRDITADSLNTLIYCHGYRLRIDTLWDINHIKSTFFIRQIERADSLRKNLKWFAKIPLDQYCRYILPYRLNNEKYIDYKGFYEKRYGAYLHDVVMSHLDTSRTLTDYVSLSFSKLFFPQIKYVNFINNTNPDTLYDGNDKLTDREDNVTLNIHALRTIGVPSTYEYLPYVKDVKGSVLKISTIGIGQKSVSEDKKWLYKFRIAKCYQNVHDLRGVINPYRQLLQMGIDPRDIPLSLNLPKMKDITQERTIAKNISIGIPDSLLRHKVIYVSTNNDDKWQAVTYGKVNRSTKTIQLKQMGTEVCYHLATFINGRMSLVGAPFTVDSTGKTLILCPPKSSKGTLKIDNYQGGGLHPIKSYQLYYWQSTQKKWMPGSDWVSGSELLLLNNIPMSTIYKLKESTDANSNGRIFSYINEKQKWL